MSQQSLRGAESSEQLNFEEVAQAIEHFLTCLPDTERDRFLESIIYSTGVLNNPDLLEKVTENFTLTDFLQLSPDLRATSRFTALMVRRTMRNDRNKFTEVPQLFVGLTNPEDNIRRELEQLAEAADSFARVGAKASNEQVEVLNKLAVLADFAKRAEKQDTISSTKEKTVQNLLDFTRVRYYGDQSAIEFPFYNDKYDRLDVVPSEHNVPETGIPSWKYLLHVLYTIENSFGITNNLDPENLPKTLEGWHYFAVTEMLDLTERINGAALYILMRALVREGYDKRTLSFFEKHPKFQNFSEEICSEKETSFPDRVKGLLTDRQLNLGDFDFDPDSKLQPFGRLHFMYQVFIATEDIARYIRKASPIHETFNKSQGHTLRDTLTDIQSFLKGNSQEDAFEKLNSIINKSAEQITYEDILGLVQLLDSVGRFTGVDKTESDSNAEYVQAYKRELALSLILGDRLDLLLCIDNNNPGVALWRAAKLSIERVTEKDFDDLIFTGQAVISSNFANNPPFIRKPKNTPEAVGNFLKQARDFRIEAVDGISGDIKFLYESILKINLSPSDLFALIVERKDFTINNKRELLDLISNSIDQGEGAGNTNGTLKGDALDALSKITKKDDWQKLFDYLKLQVVHEVLEELKPSTSQTHA